MMSLCRCEEGSAFNEKNKKDHKRNRMEKVEMVVFEMMVMTKETTSQVDNDNSHRRHYLFYTCTSEKKVVIS